jgi:excisionase family DNA binding protein
MTVETKLATAGEVATVLGVHVNYVYDKAKNGGLPSYKIGGVRRFDLTEVQDWLRETCRA